MEATKLKEVLDDLSGIVEAVKNATTLKLESNINLRGDGFDLTFNYKEEKP